MASKYPPQQQQYHQVQMETDMNVGDMKTDLERVERTVQKIQELNPEMATNGFQHSSIDQEQQSIITELTCMAHNYDRTSNDVLAYIRNCLGTFGEKPCSGGGGGGGFGGRGRHGKMGRMDHRMMGGFGGEYMDEMGGGYAGFNERPWACFYCQQSPPFDEPCKGNKETGHAAVPQSLIYEHQSSRTEASRLEGEENKLKSQIKDLEGRLKAEMGVKEGDKDVRINLKMDASSISARYSQICVKEREDARKEIAYSVKDDNKILRDLCKIIMISGEVTTSVVGGFRKSIEAMILNPSMDANVSKDDLVKTKKEKWTAEHDRALNELLRSVSSQVNIESLMNQVLTDANLPYTGAEFRNFVKETVLIAWIMAMQTPVMSFYIPQKGGEKLRDAFEDYDGRGVAVDPTKYKDVLYVCPALREGPSPLSRGKVKVLKS